MKAVLLVLLVALLSVSPLADPGDLAQVGQRMFDSESDASKGQPIEPESTPLNPAETAQEATGQSNPAVERSDQELREAASSRRDPIYPPLAKAARVSGSVEVKISIDMEGHVKKARAISGHPLLKDSAVAAAQAWKFDVTRLSLAQINLCIETDTDKKRLIQREAIEAQDHYLKLRREQEGTEPASFGDRSLYKWGFPRLTVTPLPPPLPPPPRPRSQSLGNPNSRNPGTP